MYENDHSIKNLLTFAGASVRLSSLKAKHCRGTLTPCISYTNRASFPYHYSPVTFANKSIQTPFNMPPKKKVERAATENISLGPQVREGGLHICPSFQDANKLSP